MPRRVAARWPSPRALLGLVIRSGCRPARDFPRDTPWGRVDHGTTLLTFASPSEKRPVLHRSFTTWRRPPALGPACRARAARSSSLGVVKVRPSIGISARCPLPGPPAALASLWRHLRGGDPPGGWSLRPGAATSRTRSVPAVPPGFDGLLHLGLTGLLHPETDHGVRRVSGRLAPDRASTTDLGTRSHPAHPGEPGGWGARAVPGAPRRHRRDIRGRPVAIPATLTPFGAFPFAAAAPRHPDRVTLDLRGKPARARG